MLKYTENNEWLSIENDSAMVGIAPFAREQLGDLVFVDLPKPGDVLQRHGVAVVVESVKAVSEVYAPVGGEVIEVNQRASEDPTLVNSDPTGAGWMFKMKIAEKSQLGESMDESSYRSLLENKNRLKPSS